MAETKITVGESVNHGPSDITGKYMGKTKYGYKYKVCGVWPDQYIYSDDPPPVKTKGTKYRLYITA